MPIILVLISHYLPGHKAGGPVRTIANMVQVLGDEFDFRIVTFDRDLLDKNPYAGISSEVWVKQGKASVFYISPDRFGVQFLRKILSETPHDVLYLNSLFSPGFSIVPLLLTRLGLGSNSRVVVAPRGELSPGALSLKGTKKSAFIKFATTFGLYKNVVWQASSDDEAVMVRRFFEDATNVVVARDLPDSSILRGAPQFPVVSDRLRVLFLSRISPMKNLHFALEVMAKCNFPLVFHIWGTVEDASYWEKCRSLIGELPNHIDVQYKGVAAHEDVSRIMASYDLLFLPTLGENYGHVIAEAVSVGTPVLISDRTPWRGLEQHCAGWDLPLEQGAEPFAEAIAKAAQRDQEALMKWRWSTYDYAVSFLLDSRVVEANKALLS